MGNAKNSSASKDLVTLILKSTGQSYTDWLEQAHQSFVMEHANLIKQAFTKQHHETKHNTLEEK